MKLPDFLIVGTAKAGTTTLFKYLGECSSVYTPPLKEPCYFSDGQPYTIYSDDEYSNLFAGKSSGEVSGEASTNYLYDEHAASKIKQLMPDVKIIIMLREPASRAYSLWGHNYYQVGCEKLSFEEALKEENKRMKSEKFKSECKFYHGNFFYFHSGLYYEQVKRYFDFFGRENVYVGVFEEFKEKPDIVFKSICSFLKIKSYHNPDYDKKYNVSPGYRFSLLHNFFVSPPSLLVKAYNSLPLKIRTYIYECITPLYRLNLKHTPRPLPDKTIMSDLKTRYRKNIGQLEELTGRKMPW